MPKAVGRNVPRKEGRDKVTGASRYIDDLSFPEPAPRAHDPLDDSRGRDRRHPFPVRHDRLHHRRLSATSRAATRRADRRRPAVPGRARRSATSPSRSCSWRTTTAIGCWRPTSRIDYRAGARRTTIRRRRRLVQVDRDRQRRSRRRLGRGRRRSSKASIASATRSSSTSSPTASSPCRPTTARHHGVRVAAVPVLRAPRADGAARLLRRPRARRADGNRRRLRRQGGVSVDDRRPRGARWRSRRAGRSSWSTTASKTCWRRPSGIPASSGIAPA